MRRSEMKQKTHKRIVEEAARQFRAEGIHPVGIAELMEQIGLTHGGFYAHFRNKDALTAEACSEGLAQTQEMLLQVAQKAPAGSQLIAMIESYLSTTHQNHPEAGCVAAALSAEIARSPQEVRTAYTQALQKLLTQIAAFVPEEEAEERNDQALMLFAGMVGTLMLARAVNDPAMSERLLRVNREFYQQAFAE
jgi:TetR/AcrR family transcriptional regulator, transcriptional repressor for nem operon